MIREMGYEPVRNETGVIPYSKEEPLESSAYREVELCDIIVSIIGGRFGSESRVSEGSSISQKELKHALERGVQVYIFIERSVNAEYSTYLLNKDASTTKYKFVDDSRIYPFIEEMRALPQNNAIATFETSAEITDYLRAQWAGLFQRFLQEHKRLSELRILEEMNSVAKTLRETVDFLTKERSDKDEAIKGILLANHPAFRRFQEVTGCPYRVFFSNRSEFEKWMRARTWTPVEAEHLDPDSVEEWTNSSTTPRWTGYLKITHKIFDDGGKLKTFTEGDWHDEWVTFVKTATATKEDDVPF